MNAAVARSPFASRPDLYAPGFADSPYWHEGVDLAVPDPGPALPATADVLVIGAGYTGLSAAAVTAAAGRHTVVLEAATLGIPLVYYGTEQALTGVPAGADAAGNLAGMGLRSPGQGGDRYLREAMFGPLHPRPSGRAGRDDLDALDRRLPGFGPFGTCGRHVFDPESPWYQAVAALNRARRDHPVLATGAITWLPTGRVDRGRFGRPLPAGTVAWARRSGTDVAVLVVRGAQGPVPDDPDHPDDVPSVEVSLPDWPGLATLRPVARVSGRGCHRLSGDLPVDRLPQSDLPVLDVGRVAPGTVLVLVGTLATAPGQHRQEG